LYDIPLINDLRFLSVLSVDTEIGPAFDKGALPIEEGRYRLFKRGLNRSGQRIGSNIE